MRALFADLVLWCAGRLAMVAGCPDIAAEIARRALSRWPLPGTYLDLVVALERAGAHGEAQRWASLLISKHPRWVKLLSPGLLRRYGGRS